MNTKKIFKACMYVRLSKEDSNKTDLESESNSIQNQKTLIQSFIDSQDDIELVSIKIDDGYTGTNFNRQGFTELLDDIEEKRIDCVIVKDLSRLGRNFAQTGKYLKDTFSRKGIRFIAINDNVDTAVKDSNGNNIVVSFKNLMNEAVSSDISDKTRSSLMVKREKGDNTSGSPCYGYLRNPMNKSKLIIDDLAQPIVIEIFNKKFEGMTSVSIAKYLNDKNVLTPNDHKKFLKSRPTEISAKDILKFKEYNWSAKTVGRILENPMYIGTLTQGKVSTPNYKVRKKTYLPENEWIVIENSHEPIISRELFYEIQEKLKKEIRVSKTTKEILKLSGLLTCNDCKSQMIRKNNGTKDKPYYSYVCSNNKNKRGCESSHIIKESVLEGTLIEMIKAQMKKIGDIEKYITNEDGKSYIESKKVKYTTLLEENNEQYNKLLDKSVQVYDDYKSELINKEEYLEYKSNYDSLAKEKLNEIYSIKKQLEQLEVGVLYEIDWINKFKEFGTIETIDRKFIVSLVDEIFVYRNADIHIKFKFSNELDNINTFFSKKEKLNVAPVREVV